MSKKPIHPILRAVIGIVPFWISVFFYLDYSLTLSINEYDLPDYIANPRSPFHYVLFAFSFYFLLVSLSGNWLVLSRRSKSE